MANGLTRLTEPMIREDGALRVGTWDDALDRAAGALRDAEPDARLPEPVRLRAQHRNVVDAMIDEVLSDCIMDARHKRDFQFCADAVSRSDKNRRRHFGKFRVKHSAETTDFR